MTAEAMAALSEAAALSEDRRVDIMNRALIIYAELLKCGVDSRRYLRIDLFGDGRTYKVMVVD